MFPTNPHEWCTQAVSHHTQSNPLMTLGLILTCWVVVGIVVLCVAYWSVPDDEVSVYDPEGFVAGIELFLLFAVGWPVPLYWMYVEGQVRDDMRRYNSMEGLDE